MRTGDCNDYVNQAIADKLIVLVEAAERDPDVLRERALGDICGPYQPKTPITCSRKA